MKLSSDDLNLVAAALNFAHWNQDAFKKFYEDQGHPDVANNTERLDPLRQEVHVMYSEKMDEEWSKKKGSLRKMDGSMLHQIDLVPAAAKEKESG